ncbi:hypothetical protein MYAM1_003603 [Malassezia yamatoensis]|uniref:Protein kinase domain-containing protein n=1 Tax=Malassezia yamatoensis TaxID=253288 RepID=A0AAJ5YW22_9BASI|nr:hypothetical protein MYAM1_003603 [Malassezia yamatoensis]
MDLGQASDTDATSSRNDLFFQTVLVPSPPKAKPPISADKKQPLSPRMPSNGKPTRRGHSKQPSLGRISMQQRDLERERIRADQDVDVRVLLEREYKLGEGRNAEVYLGSYRMLSMTDSSHSPQPSSDWKLCAVKRMQVDRESQLAGLDEVFALRRLGSHPNIVKLITVVDEVGMRATPQRSTSLSVPGTTPSGDLPRLLILLEYLPWTLSRFTQQHSQAVDAAQYIAWAKQLAGTVEWLHLRGCVHGDIKMQNVLLSAELEIKLCDFTSVLFSNAAEPATDCLTVGTPAYSAPELFTSSRWTPSEGQDPTHPALSYTLDIFSLGVLLYSLATGVEPSRHVHSMMAMRHRQHSFFESEEQDRLERLELPRTNRHLRTPSNSSSQQAMARQRSGSQTSTHLSPHSGISSVVIDRLLDPTSDLHGVVSQQKSRGTVADAAALLRTKSMSATTPSTARTNHGLHHATAHDTDSGGRRPWGLERATSDVRGSAAVGRQRVVDGRSDRDPFARFNQSPDMYSSPFDATTSPPPLDSVPRSESDDRDREAYADGAPALIFPGGGRMPDALRTLLQAMVSPIPEQRPTATYVRQQLDSLS